MYKDFSFRWNLALADSEAMSRFWRWKSHSSLNVIIHAITRMVIGFQLVMIALRASRPRHKPHNLGNSMIIMVNISAKFG